MMKLLFYASCLIAGGILGWEKNVPSPHVAEAVVKPEASAVVPEARWSSWADRMANAAPAELAALLEEIGGIQDSGEKDEVMGLLISRWIDVDPGAGFEVFRENFPFNDQVRYLTEWARSDLGGVLAAISGLGDEADHFSQNVGAALYGIDMESYWEYFKRTGVPDMSSESPVFAEMLGRRFEEFVKVAEDFGRANLENARRGRFGEGGLSYHVCREFAKRDPQAGLAWVKSLPDGMKSGAAKTFLMAWAETDPLAAGEQLDSLRDSFGYRQTGPTEYTGGGLSEIADRIISSLGKSDPLAALEWVEQHPDSEYSAAFSASRFISSAIAAGTISFQDAYQKLLEISSGGVGSEGSSLLSHLGTALSGKEIGASLRWLTTQEAGAGRDAAIKGLATRWLRVDPVGFAAYASEGQLGSEGGAKAFSGTMAPSEIPAALGALAPEDRAAGVAGTLGQLAFAGTSLALDPQRRFDPAIFAQALEGAPVNGAFGEAVTSLGRFWGISDPDSALAWVDTLPVSEERSSALGSVAESWAKHDTFGLSEYFASAEAGPDRDVAIGSLVSEIVAQEPESAWVWARSISDLASQASMRQDVITQWRQVDPVGARAAVLGAENLSPTERGALLQLAETP